jgi:hypothetical protein
MQSLALCFEVAKAVALVELFGELFGERGRRWFYGLLLRRRSKRALIYSYCQSSNSP